MKGNRGTSNPSRRQFLRAGVAGGAGLMVAPLGAFGSVNQKIPADVALSAV